MIPKHEFAWQSAILAALLGGGFLCAGNVAPASAAEAKTLDLTYDAVMDMVRPQYRPKIVVHHNLHVVVSDQDVTEDRNRSYRALSDSDAMSQQIGSSSETYVSWNVTEPNRLIRIERDPQSTRTMVISIGPDKTCRLEVTDELSPGFTEYKFSRIGTHRDGASPDYGYFSTYRVTQTSCMLK